MVVGIVRVLHYEGVRQGCEEGRVLAAEGVASITVDVGARLCVLHEHRAAAVLMQVSETASAIKDFRVLPVLAAVLVCDGENGRERGRGRTRVDLHHVHPAPI